MGEIVSEPSLAAQRLAVVTMRANAALLKLVPASNIFDRHTRPEVFPCVVVGEAQTVADEAECVVGSEVFLTIHVWTVEQNFTTCKEIAGAVRSALRGLEGKFDGHELWFTFEDSTFLRDPSGSHSHGVLNFMAIAEELA